MTEEFIVCQRCLCVIEGAATIRKDGLAIGTSGYYLTPAGSYWSKYANEGENIVCDQCMWNDDRYIQVYGNRAAAMADAFRKSQE